MIFSGIFPYKLCADELKFDVTQVSTDCVNTNICFQYGSSWLDAFLGWLYIPDSHLVIVNQLVIFKKMILGECNVYAHESISNNLHPVESNKKYYEDKEKKTEEPIDVASRTDDIKFSDFLKWIVYGFFHAEDKGITMANFDFMSETEYFGDSLSKMWKDSVGNVGNYV